jgi:hypothetical protein
MTFPACSSAFDSRTPAGRVVHRVCLGDEKPTYRLAVTARACRLCQAPNANDAGANQQTPTDARLPDTPGLVRRTLSYAEALIAWTAAGRPKRPDKEVERIFHQQCKPCKWYDPERQICRGCGCRVADNGYAVLNKIKMATENCPRELW